MKIAVLLPVVLGLGLMVSAAGAAESPQSGLIRIAECQTRDEKVEARAAVIAAKLKTAFATGDAATIRGLVPDMEKAMAEAPQPPVYAEKCDTRVIVYSDNLPSHLVLGVLLEAAAAKSNAQGKTEIVSKPPSPFATIAFGLSWAYADRKDYGQCVDVAADGRQRDPWDEAMIAEHLFCLAQAGRVEETLAEADTLLTGVLFSLSDSGKAAVLRRKGYALIELNRWDEAEAAYVESLKLAPDHKIAQSELEYIRQKKPKM